MKMHSYVHMIVVSMIARKVLLENNNGIWELPKRQMGNGETIEKIVVDSRIQYNFIIDPQTCSYTIRETNKIDKYIWLFSCIENLKEHENEYKWIEVKQLDEKEEIKNFVNKYIKKDIIAFVNKVEKGKEFKASKIQSSKQAYSRIAPLKLLYEQMKIVDEPAILDSFYIDKTIGLSNKSTNEIIIEKEEFASWGIVNLLPFLLYRHRLVIIKSIFKGCDIGKRPMAIYFYIMNKFGVDIQISQDIKLKYSSQYVSGNLEVTIPNCGSFTATSMAIYFAMLRKGMTTIKNCSIEPEILYLIKVIEDLGYCVLRQERTFSIYKKQNLEVLLSSPITIPVDRNVLVTRLICNIFYGKEFCYEGTELLYFENLIEILKKCGVYVYYNGYNLYVKPKQRVCDKNTDILFGHFPELCTDWHPILSLLFLKNRNKTVLYDSVFEDRFRYLIQMKQLYTGLNIQLCDYMAIFYNCQPNSIMANNINRNFSMLDIRAAAALLIALSQIDNYTISNIEQMFRGYESAYQISEEIGEKLKYEFNE